MTSTYLPVTISPEISDYFIYKKDNNFLIRDGDLRKFIYMPFSMAFFGVTIKENIMNLNDTNIFTLSYVFNRLWKHGDENVPELYSIIPDLEERTLTAYNVLSITETGNALIKLAEEQEYIKMLKVLKFMNKGR